MFDVDGRRLEASYKQLQRRLHPDKYAAASQVLPPPPSRQSNTNRKHLRAERI